MGRRLEEFQEDHMHHTIKDLTPKGDVAFRKEEVLRMNELKAKAHAADEDPFKDFALPWFSRLMYGEHRNAMKGIVAVAELFSGSVQRVHPSTPRRLDN